MSWLPILALAISALSLCVAMAGLMLNRNDKGQERVEQLKASFTSAISRVESALTTRIDHVESHGDERHEANVDRLRHIDSGLARLTGQLDHIPQQGDMRRLADSISTLSQRLGQMEGALAANTRMTEGINQFLRESKS